MVPTWNYMVPIWNYMVPTWNYMVPFEFTSTLKLFKLDLESSIIHSIFRKSDSALILSTQRRNRNSNSKLYLKKRQKQYRYFQACLFLGQISHQLKTNI